LKPFHLRGKLNASPATFLLFPEPADPSIGQLGNTPFFQLQKEGISFNGGNPGY
jgi:hypothetical protein